MRFIFLLIAAGAVFYLATHTEFHFYSSSSAQPLGALDAFPSDAVSDVRAVAEASASSDADETAARINTLLQHATNIGPARGAALLRRRLPKLVAQVDAAIPLLHGRIAAVPVRTSTGVRCREVMLDLVARQGRNVRMLGSELKGNTRRAVDRSAGRANRMTRWYAGQIVRCTRSAAPEDRTALVQAMRGF